MTRCKIRQDYEQNTIQIKRYFLTCSLKTVLATLLGGAEILRFPTTPCSPSAHNPEATASQRKNKFDKGKILCV